MSAAPSSSPPSIGDRAPTMPMSPHDPSLRSLLGALLEPNLLVLAVYLAINLYLARRVIRLATRRHGELRTAPPESGEFGSIIADPDMPPNEFLQAHRSLFDRTPQRPRAVSDTRVADALIRLATWAFKANAARAKALVAVLALVSLGSTWYYMIAFLRHSYLAYLERCHLTGYLLPPAPPAFRLSEPHLLVPALHLRLLRMSQWLASLSLFKEAWMEVIRDAPAWWWSSEICIVTVGGWALFLRREAGRLRIPHVWIVMVLGQLVAISFALNLFHLAVIYRLDARDLLAARADKVLRPKRRAIEPLEGFSLSRPDTSPEPSREETPGEGPYRVAMMLPHDPQPRGLMPQDSLPPTPRRSPDPNQLIVSTNVIVQRKPLPPRPTLMDSLGSAMQRCIPERIGLPLFVIAGLSSVVQHPDSFTKVMVMHLFPLLISLYPAHDQIDTTTPARSTRPHSRFEGPVDRSPSPPPSRALTKGEALRRLFARGDERVPLLQDAKTVYLGLGLASIVLRIWLTVLCYSQTLDNASTLQRTWRAVVVLFPTTFLRHPAQSSISSDHVCVALSVFGFVLIESGLWLWKAALASPGSHSYHHGLRQPDQDDDDDAMFAEMHPREASTVRLDAAGRAWIETQARVVVGLLALSPMLGGSATLCLYLALRSDWVEQDRRRRERRDERLLHFAPDRQPGEVVVEETEEVQLVENAEGERYVELRKTKVKWRHPRNAAPAEPAELAAPAAPAAPRAGGGVVEAVDLPSPPSEGADEADRAQPPEAPARRTPPIRHRHPPQRYGDD